MDCRRNEENDETVVGGNDMKKRMTAVLLAAMLAISTAACGGNGSGSEGGDTLVIGTSKFNGVFSPFFYNSAYDREAFRGVFETVLEPNENNELIDNAGHIDEGVVKGKGDKQTTTYTISLNEGMKFSDGEPVTIDDLIFTYKVYADPNYDGIATFRTAVDIQGMNEYYYDVPDYESKVKEIAKEAEEKAADKDAFIQYLIDSKCDDWFTSVDQDPDGESGDLTSWSDYLKQYGITLSEADAKDEAKVLKALAECEYENFKDSYDAVSYYTTQLNKEYIQGNLEDGIDVPEIAGIQKVDDLTCKVTINGIDINATRQLGDVEIMPEHYYGKGFTKGNLESVKSKNGTPMGSGPFKFVSNENNVVTLERNDNYRLGTPKLKYIKYQVINDEQKLQAVMNGEVDITDPNASKEVLEELKENEIKYDLVDNPGYGYIAISAKRVPDKNVREGLMHLMMREQAIKTYYGEVAHVIERPMTPTLAEYPDDATEYWGYDVDKALECFKAAGYEQVNGKLVKDGKQLKITVAIGEASIHPSTPILTQMKSDLAKLGGELVIEDVDNAVLFDRIDNDDLDMWVAAWGNSTNCDLTQMFGSEYTKKGGSNRTWVQDPELDKMLAQTMKILDLEERKAHVAKELDFIMSWATYMPVYQRSNLLVYSSNVNTDTIPANTSTYYDYRNELEKIELN